MSLFWCDKEWRRHHKSGLNMYFYENYTIINFRCVCVHTHLKWLGTKSQGIFHTHWNLIVWFSHVVLSGSVEPICLSGHSISYILVLNYGDCYIFKLYFYIVCCFYTIISLIVLNINHSWQLLFNFLIHYYNIYMWWQFCFFLIPINLFCLPYWFKRGSGIMLSRILEVLVLTLKTMF